MSRVKARLPLIGLIMLPIVAARAADTSGDFQGTPPNGLYAVARLGGSINSEAKFKASALPDLSLDDTAKYKRSPFGEVGAGYRVGAFRVEETLGYSSSDSKNTDQPGRARAYSLILSGFVDVPLNDRVVPYFGGGLGAVMVDARASVPDSIAPAGTTLGSKSWGPLWHLDAGVGFRVTPRVTLEVGGRYEQTLNMRKRGTNDSDFLVPLSRYNSMIGTVGVRYAF